MAFSKVAGVWIADPSYLRFIRPMTLLQVRYQSEASPRALYGFSNWHGEHHRPSRSLSREFEEVEWRWDGSAENETVASVSMVEGCHPQSQLYLGFQVRVGSSAVLLSTSLQAGVASGRARASSKDLQFPRADRQKGSVRI